MKFENPTNGYIETLEGAGVASLLFGPFYLGAKGAWGWAALGIVAAFLTFGLSWLILPLFVKELLRRHFLSRGWRELEDQQTFAPQKPKHNKSRAELEAMIGVKK